MTTYLPTSLRRRATLGGLAAACALAALPAAANAADVTKNAAGQIVVRDGDNQINEIQLARDLNASTITIDDRARSLKDSAAGCEQVTSRVVRCAGAPVRLELGGGNDRVLTVPNLVTTIVAGSGADYARLGTGPGLSAVDFFGGAGVDTADFSSATGGVRVDKNGIPDDGRTNDDDNVRGDVEHLIGSSFDDVLIGSAGDDVLDAGPGDDTTAGVAGTNTHVARGAFDGKDTVIGGTGFDYADYSDRATRVLVSVDGQANDGGVGEGDNVSAVEGILGGAGNDVLRADLNVASIVQGGGGNDFLFGGNKGDYLQGDAGQDGLSGGEDNDSLQAADGELDELLCGIGTDTVGRDATERRIEGCEPSQVGTVRIARTTVEAGERAALKVRWTHPRAWRSLKQVRVALVDANHLPVGTVTVKPRGGRVQATGAALGLRASAVELGRAGRTVTARIALRPTAALAGTAVSAHVVATERSGRTQMIVKEGVLRVAR